MRFYHQTKPGIALHLIRTKEFYSCRIESDNGLNGYINKSQLRNTYLEGRGAELVLQWMGPVKDVNAEEIYFSEMNKNVLYSQFIQTEMYDQPKRWREFIPSPMNENLLKIVNIRFVGGNKIDCIISYPNWYRFVPFQKLKTKLEREFKLRFIRELRDNYINRDLFLKIN